MDRVIVFEVYGIPQPKGSTKAFMRPGMKFPIVTSDNSKLKPWAQEVTKTAMQYRPVDGPWQGPVSLTLTFQLPKPKGLPKTRFSFHLKKPDIDKLTRGILDALTGVFWYDDSQVVEIRVMKLYADVPSVIISPNVVTDELHFMERHLGIRRAPGY